MLIPWSGGVDSTVILYDALTWWYGSRDTEWSSYEGPNRKYELTKDDLVPRAITFECNQFSQKQEEMQTKARDKLQKVFKSKKWDFEHKTFKIDTSDSYNINGTFPQPVMWLATASLFVMDKEPLLVGWVKGDCAMNYLSEFRELWRLLTSLNGKKSELVTPLVEFSKYEVARRAKDLKILNKCWYCELPTETGKACGACDCCLTMIGAKAIMDSQDKVRAKQQRHMSKYSKAVSDLKDAVEV